MSICSRRSLVTGFAVLLLSRSVPAAGADLEVWKLRGCGCCVAWARQFQATGFATSLHDVDDLGAVRSALGVPADLAGCHTSRVAGYLVEGHVPVAAVRRMLEERPAILGLAVPGMPAGSPGMEMPGQAVEPYDVISFAADGSRAIFMPMRS